MSFRSVPLALVAVVVFAAGGCGGSDDPKDASSSPTVSAKPATGDAVTGTGYSFSAPKDWHTPTKKIPGFDPDALVLDTTDKDGFADNINVLRGDAKSISSTDDLEKVSKRELESIHAADIKVKGRQQIDGETAVHLTSTLTQNGVVYHADQFAMLHDDVEYVITFSRSASVPRSDEESLAQSVMATWKWGA